jgi:hypothetical protein
MLQVGSGKVVEAMKNIAREDRNTYLIPQSLNQDSKDYYPRNPPPVGHYTYEGMKKIGLEFYKLYSGIIKE